MIKQLRRKLSRINTNIELLEEVVSRLRISIRHQEAVRRGYITAYRRYIKAGEDNKAKDEAKKIRTIERVLRKDRTTFDEQSSVLDRLIKDKIKLEIDIEVALRKLPEVIDIDEETGFFIFYDKTVKKYFIGEDEEEKPERYFKTLVISVNFTFDTQGEEKYPGQNIAELTLEAEVRITVSVREAGRRLAEAIPYKLKLSFERFVTMFFEAGHTRGRGASPWLRGIVHTIADGVTYKQTTLEFRTKEDRIDKFEEIMPEVMKAGVFYRVNDSPPTLDIIAGTVEPDVYGEWSRARGSAHSYSESITEEFDLQYEMNHPLEWSTVRRKFVGETGFEQLRRIKMEEEKKR